MNEFRRDAATLKTSKHGFVPDCLHGHEDAISDLGLKALQKYCETVLGKLSQIDAPYTPLNTKDFELASASLNEFNSFLSVEFYKTCEKLPLEERALHLRCNFEKRQSLLSTHQEKLIKKLYDYQSSRSLENYVKTEIAWLGTNWVRVAFFVSAGAVSGIILQSFS